MHVLRASYGRQPKHSACLIITQSFPTCVSGVDAAGMHAVLGLRRSQAAHYSVS